MANCLNCRNVMVKPGKSTEWNELGQIAEESGLAIALVDENSREIRAFNNNSICETLNPNDQYSAECSRFCGQALHRAYAKGTTIGFECHAGLECRAVPIGEKQPLVAIIGRAFTNAENYRKATERSIKGDWGASSPEMLFRNILLARSADVIDEAARQISDRVPSAHVDSIIDPKAAVEKRPKMKDDRQKRKSSPQDLPGIVERFNREVGLDPGFTHPQAKKEAKQTAGEETVAEPPPSQSGSQPQISIRSEQAVDDQDSGSITRSREWRSFFSSLGKTDYQSAALSILEFLCREFGLSGALWLEKSDDRFRTLLSVGDLKDRRINLGITPYDVRLLDAFRNERPLILSEDDRSKPAETVKRLHLFPIGTADESSAAIGILKAKLDDQISSRIAKVCRAVVTQLEILRLRDRLAVGESKTNAVRRFSETLRSIDHEDFWLDITQTAAEILKAERVSLMIFDEESASLVIKAMVGAHANDFPGNAIGQRVARIIFEKGKPALVSDIAKFGLPPTPVNRGYKTPSFLICPIILGNKMLGVINFADRTGGISFDNSSLDLFHAFAPQLAVAVDRAILKEKAGEFEQLSVTDSLTGLLNRRYIDARLSEEIKRSNRHGFPMSFMMLDVDHFKSFNDRFGHPAGDEALKLVGSVIRETLRAADVAARYGGEEFSILLPQTTSEEAMIIAERIRQNIEKADFHHRQITASIGVASCSAELCVATELVSSADKALYEAKKHGRNRVLSFESISQ